VTNRFVLSQWDFEDPQGSRARFEAAIAVLQTQIARAHGLSGDFDQGLRVLDTVTLPGEPHVRALLERGRLLRSSGDPSAAEPLFQQAFERAVELGLIGVAADAAHMLALVLPDEHEQWARRGLALAADSDEPLAQAMAGALLNNLGWKYADAGRWDEAYPLFDRAVAARLRVAETVPGRAAQASLHVARWTRARAARALGRHAEALAEMKELACTEIGAADPYVAEELSLLGPDAQRE
jgi:tetratricopeptide (TPR) repeat protein